MPHRVRNSHSTLSKKLHLINQSINFKSQMPTAIECCKHFTTFNFNSTNYIFRRRFVCKRYFDSLFITFTGTAFRLSTDSCSIIVILFKVLLIHVVKICTLCFKAKFKISLANAKHLLCIFTSTKVSSNRLIYVWPPRGAVENPRMVIAMAKN